MSYNETLERQYLRSIPQQGKVEWIGIRPKRLLEVQSVSEVTANSDTGLEGDQWTAPPNIQAGNHQQPTPGRSQQPQQGTGLFQQQSGAVPQQLGDVQTTTCMVLVPGAGPGGGSLMMPFDMGMLGPGTFSPAVGVGAAAPPAVFLARIHYSLTKIILRQ